MLTRMFSAVPSDSWPLMAGVVALSLLGAPVTSAEAGGIVAGTCVRSLGSLSCVARWGESGDPNIRDVPGPRNAQEEAEFVERDRKWVARCRPVIRQDQYGVGRYYYAAPGCEFGRIQD